MNHEIDFDRNHLRPEKCNSISIHDNDKLKNRLYN